MTGSGPGDPSRDRSQPLHPAAPAGSRIDRRLAEAREELDRVAPADLAGELAAGALVVDLRPDADRTAEGELPGAVVVERIHLEWRLDRTSGAALPGVHDDRRVVLVCNDGYSSSLAAADLRGLGLRRVTDLDGGYRAWRRAASRGWSTEPPAPTEPPPPPEATGPTAPTEPPIA